MKKLWHSVFIQCQKIKKRLVIHNLPSMIFNKLQLRVIFQGLKKINWINKI
jgi:hypothetical protein